MPNRRNAQRTCIKCGGVFMTWQAEVNKGHGLYCSRKCRQTDLKPLEERFWKKVNKTDGCWLWTASTDGNKRREMRYGKIAVDGKTKISPAHRVSWELHNGAIPAGLMVLHKCDTPLCVRPDHLFLGTAQNNTDDMFAKGRARPGGRPVGTKLSPESLASYRQKRGWV